MQCTRRLIGVRRNSQLTSSGYKTLFVAKMNSKEKMIDALISENVSSKLKKKEVNFSVTFLSNVACRSDNFFDLSRLG